MEKFNTTTTGKPQVLFVGNHSYYHSHHPLREIELNRVTLTEGILKISEKESYDAVFVDGSINTTDAKLLRKSTSAKSLPLIFYTSIFDQKIKDRALQLKADDYISGSLRYSGARIKLVRQLRKFNVQWLKLERECQVKDSAMSTVLRLLRRRIPDVVVSLVALMAFSPALLVVGLIKEIDSMEEHVFSESSNKRLTDQILNWYQFIVLILFSPIFSIITFPMKFAEKQKHFHEKKNRNSRLNRILVKPTLAAFSYLLGILRGDASLFREKSLGAGNHRES